MKFKDIKLPSNKKFGYFFCIIFILVSIYFYIQMNMYLTYLFLVLFLSFFIITTLKPLFLRPLNLSWMFIGFILGKIISPIILGLMFFLLITSFGLVRRLFGSDELKISKNRKKSTWIVRNKSFFEKDSFRNQF